LKQFWKDKIKEALIHEMDGAHVQDVRFVLTDFGSENGDGREG
jgi:hypothetical protein